MDLLIPLLILAGLACLVFYSCFMVSSEESRREEKEHQEKKYAHEPMDLRLKDDPCETKEN